MFGVGLLFWVFSIIIYLYIVFCNTRMYAMQLHTIVSIVRISNWIEYHALQELKT